jgi:hypothetical protein
MKLMLTASQGLKPDPRVIKGLDLIKQITVEFQGLVRADYEGGKSSGHDHRLGFRQGRGDFAWSGALGQHMSLDFVFIDA